MNTINKKYDVVILTHKPKDDLTYSVNLLLKQKIKPETIVICNTDKSVFYNNIKKVKIFDKTLSNKRIKIVHINKSEFDHGKTRNDAMKLCKSNYILVMTDDAIPYNAELTKTLLEAFNDKTVAVAYARQIAKKNASKKEKYVREFNYPNKDIIKDKSTEKKYGIKNCFCSNSCAMYDIKKFNKLGKFSTGLPQNEDMLYAYKAIEKGYKIVYKSKAIVYHSHNLSYIDQFIRNKNIGKFQQVNKNIYSRYKSEGEGLKLIKYVNTKLLKNKDFLSTIDFNIECLFRYAGYLVGKRG